MKRTINTVQIMKYDPTLSVNGLLEISPDLRHVARGFQWESKQYIKMDEVQGGYFDRIMSPMIFSPDGNHFAYNAHRDAKWFVVIDEQEFGPYEDITKGGPWFSPDSRQVAFGYALNGEWFYYLDDQKQGPFNAVGVGVFSPDSQHFAYKAGMYSKNKQCLMLNGSPGQLFDHVDDPRFSPDSQHFAYAARKGSEWCAILDGQPEDFYQDAHVQPHPFSADSQCFGYDVKINNKVALIIDGDMYGPYDSLTSPREKQDSPLIFSSSGRHFAFGYRNEKECFINLNGQPSGPFDDAGQLLFSPDGERFAYVRAEKKKRFGILTKKEYFMVLDGETSRSYESVSFGVFSPDSQRFAFTAQENNLCFTVIDSIEGESYPNAGYVFFSPDSKKTAYAIMIDKKYQMIYEDSKYGPFDKIFGSCFTPDCRGFVFMGATIRNSSVYINGLLGETFDVIAPREDIVVEFDSPTKFHYLGIRDFTVFQIDETIHWEEDG